MVFEWFLSNTSSLFHILWKLFMKLNIRTTMLGQTKGLLSPVFCPPHSHAEQYHTSPFAPLTACPTWWCSQEKIWHHLASPWDKDPVITFFQLCHQLPSSSGGVKEMLCYMLRQDQLSDTLCLARTCARWQEHAEATSAPLHTQTPQSWAGEAAVRRWCSPHQGIVGIKYLRSLLFPLFCRHNKFLEMLRIKRNQCSWMCVLGRAGTGQVYVTLLSRTLFQSPSIFIQKISRG